MKDKKGPIVRKKPLVTEGQNQQRFQKQHLIDPKARLLDFAKIKAVSIDPRISYKVTDLISKIRKNLNELRKHNL